MPEQCVPTAQTLCAPKDLYTSLRAAWDILIQDSTCTRASLLVLLAHWALETGFGHYAWCWNIANKKHVPGDGHSYYMIRCNEIIGGKLVWFDPPDPATWFIAYDNLDDGARDYLVGLRGRFRAAWPAVVAGDPAQFCHLLKLADYYTADEATYTASVVRCYHQLDKIIVEPDSMIETADPAI